MTAVSRRQTLNSAAESGHVPTAVDVFPAGEHGFSRPNERGKGCVSRTRYATPTQLVVTRWQRRWKKPRGTSNLHEGPAGLLEAALQPE